MGLTGDSGASMGIKSLNYVVCKGEHWKSYWSSVNKLSMSR